MLASTVLAGTRSSPNYEITGEVADLGGRRATSASYSNDGSAGMIAGTSTVASPAETARHGFIGQLHEIIGFVANTSPSTLDEGGPRQLDALQLLDDATYLALDPAQVSWSVLSGPIASISASGLATAGIVYQDTAATVRGIYQGQPSPFNLTVRNVELDNFESYAADSINDVWQVLYFGLPPNPKAGPLLDPDGDGQTNAFEFTAGLIPTDATSVFKLDIARSDQGAHLIFGPIISGRTYTPRFTHSILTPPLWPVLPPGFPLFDVGSQRTVIDTDAASVPTRFYQIEINR